MARMREVERAKKQFKAETENRDWVKKIGSGQVNGRLGLVIGVRPGAKSAASRVLNRLNLDVPVMVRSISNISARPPSKESTNEKAFESLRKAANSRINKGSK